MPEGRYNMKLKKLEKTKETLKVEVAGEDHTLLNLLRENAWKAGATQASYILEHPYLSEPKIIVRSKNPKKTLADSAQLVAAEAVAFQREFRKALKR
jgi:DNA-directed RNA polymerase subunit L